ncbi:MAG: cell division ATP-binding protein FtsE [Chloroflexi bacterium]|nr:MAG: cell division ATP-binding protein FtsE [Chloroflexota bacterium]
MAFILRRNLPWRRRSGAPSHQTTHLSVIAPDFSGRTVISFQHVWKRYPNGTDALRDINLSVPEGDFVFLVGPSGAGKSSLVRLLIREERPTKGKIFVNGVELGRMKRRKLPHFRRKVGLVFQDFKLLPQMTVHENVAFALRVLGESRQVIDRRVARALDTVSLHGKLGKYPRELSGGEQQRVAIARALVHAPRLMIADEPTGNLDPATAWEIMQLFLKINADGATVVMATHNREIVDLLRRRVVVIEDGQVVRDDRAGRYHEALQASALRA